MPANNAMCAVVQPAADVETTYFLQIVPMVYRFDPTRDAIYPGKLSGIDFASMSKSRIASTIRQLRAKAKQGHKTTESSSQFLAFARSIRREIKTPWLGSGKAIDVPQWALGIEFAQTWKSLGFGRGRLINSVPITLFPSTKEISVKSWIRRTVKSTVSQTIDSATTTEISDEDKWSLATKKQVAKQNNTSFNPSATINHVSIPVSGGIPIGAGGSLGISGQIDAHAQTSLEQGQDFVQTATQKATQSLKISRNNSVEDSLETGTETTTREVISNPNRINTLNYFYYEVIETLEVSTTPSSVGLFLLVPLTIDSNAPSLPWLLANECVLRPIMPCSTLQASFDAVKRLLVLDQVALLRTQALADQAAADAKSTQADANRAANLQKLLDAVLASYQKLSGAAQSSGPGSWLYWSFVDVLAPELRDALGTLQAAYDALDADQRKQLPQLGKILGQFFDALGSVDDAFLKVNIALDIAAGAAVTTSLFLSVAVLIWPIMAALEALGIDVVPDDDGLRKAILKLQQSYNAAFTPIPAVPAAGAGATPAQQNAAQADALRQAAIADAQFQDRAEAQIETNRLVDHVTANLEFYYQVIWSSLPEATVRQAIADAGIDPNLVEPRFVTFRGPFGVCRVVDHDRLAAEGFDIEALESRLLKKAERNQGDYTYQVTVPTPGFMVEPNLGVCDGGDPFVAGHRDLDLKARQAEVDAAAYEAERARLETVRRQAMLDDGDLSDPAPRVAPEIDVDVKNPAVP